MPPQIFFQSASASPYQWQQMHSLEPEKPDYLSIETEFSELGYRYRAKHLLENTWECTSPWVLQYSDFLLQRCLFILACEMADATVPAFLLNLSDDTIADFNFKFKQKFKLFARSPLPASKLWSSAQAYQDYKQVLLESQRRHEASLKTTEEEVLQLSLESQLYHCPELGAAIIALVKLSEVRE